MVKGRQIKIYLADGNVTGFRHAEIMGWTGQALSIPRNRIKELNNWEETHKPGVYFLFGIDPETGNDAVYIGEAEHVSSRLIQHIQSKDFWNEAICFTSKDENLTKAHVKYLEAKLVSLTNQANRFVLINGNQPPQPVLPRGDKDVMEDFINNIRLLIGALGFRILEPLVNSEAAAELQSNGCIVEETFYLKAKKYSAKSKQTNEGMVVLSGSEAALSINPSLSKGYAKIRSALIDKGKFVSRNDKLILQEDTLFTSPSQAAAIILGYPCSGPDYWLDTQGLSLKQKEA